MVKYQYSICINDEVKLKLTNITKDTYNGLINLFMQSGAELRGVTIDDSKAGGAYKVTHFARVCEDGNIFEAYFIAIFERGGQNTMTTYNYKDDVIIIEDGQTLAVVTEYAGGSWAKPRKTLCLIREHFFKNGNPKHQDFTIIRVIDVLAKGYSYTGLYKSKNYKIIQRG